MNCSKQTISNWENCKHTPSLSDVLNLCNVFNIKINQLIEEEMTILEIKNKKYLYTYIFIFIIGFIGFFVSISYVKWYGAIMMYPTIISILIILTAGWRLDKIKKDSNVENFKEIIDYLEKNK